MPTAAPFASWLITYGYGIAFPLAIIEGPLVMIACGFFIRLGIFSFWPIYLVLFAGDLTGDVIWYFVGRHGARNLINKFGRFLSLTEENVEQAEKYFHKNQTKILLLSKLTSGLGFALATLIAAGAAKVPFKKYLAVNALGEAIWAGFMVGVGYFFGNLYTLVDKSLRWAFIIGFIIVILGAGYGFSRFVKAKFKK